VSGFLWCFPHYDCLIPLIILWSLIVPGEVDPRGGFPSMHHCARLPYLDLNLDSQSRFRPTHPSPDVAVDITHRFQLRSDPYITTSPTTTLLTRHPRLLHLHHYLSRRPGFFFRPSILIHRGGRVKGESVELPFHPFHSK